MEEAQARKERLKALRQAAETQGQVGADGDAAQQQPQAPVLKFRNYAPRDEKIEHEKAAPVQVPKFEEPKAPAVDMDEDVVAAVAPKKPNWDLKREVAPKLEKLERRTQRALIQLLQQEERRRMEEEGGQED